MIAGLRTAIPASLSMIPLGLAFGVLVAQSGIDWWWGAVFAAVVFAGSFEFLLLGLVVCGAPLVQIGATALVVNLRHIFYSLTFPLARMGSAAKVYGTFALTDEVWALTATPGAQHWRSSRLLGIQFAVHVAWIGSVALGGVMGASVPPFIIGLDFALPALFVILAIDAYRARPDRTGLLAAVICGVVGVAVGAQSMLLVSVALYVGWALTAFWVRTRKEAHA